MSAEMNPVEQCPQKDLFKLLKETFTTAAGVTAGVVSVLTVFSAVFSITGAVAEKMSKK